MIARRVAIGLRQNASGLRVCDLLTLPIVVATFCISLGLRYFGVIPVEVRLLVNMQKPPEKLNKSDTDGRHAPGSPQGNQGHQIDGRKFSVKQWMSMGQLASSGMELGLTVAALTLLGWWLDTQWNSSPWMLITGAFIGTIGSFYKLYRINKRWFAKDKNAVKNIDTRH